MTTNNTNADLPWAVVHPDADDAGLRRRRFATEAEARGQADRWNRECAGHVVICPDIFWAPNSKEAQHIRLIMSMCTDCLMRGGTVNRASFTRNLRMIADQLDQIANTGGDR
jgi:hypothetical protein